MSQYHLQESSGAPTVTAVSASLNLSGLDDFNLLMDPDVVDTAEWYHSPDDHQFQQPLSPREIHGASYGFGSHFEHGTATPHSGYHHPPRLTFANHMEAAPLQPRLDSLVSPVSTQPGYPSYGAPYPDSTASSAPSEDPIVVEQQAEEDKRKRNQAASARFRQKKKQREAQMVEQSREMVERTKKLEGEVDNLTRENKFLKRLLVEKVENMSGEEKEALRKTAETGGKG